MHFRIQHPGGNVEWVAVTEGAKLRFGSHEKCDVHLAGLGIHPIHFGIVERNGKHHLVLARNDDSLLSQHVELNGQVVRKAKLRVGDEITIGEYLIEACSAVEADIERQPADELGNHASGKQPILEESSSHSHSSESELGLADDEASSVATTKTAPDDQEPVDDSWEAIDDPLLDGGDLMPLDPFLEDLGSFDDQFTNPLADSLGDQTLLQEVQHDPLQAPIENPLLAAQQPEIASPPTPVTPSESELPEEHDMEERSGLFQSAGLRFCFVFLCLALPLAGLLILVVRSLPYESNMYQDVMTAYKIQAYTETLTASGKYLRNFPKGEHAGGVAVQSGLAKLYLRLEFDATWPQVLQELDKVLEQWGTLRFHPLAQQGLAEILPKMIDGFLEQAKSNSQLVGQGAAQNATRNARKCVELARQILPAAYQREQHLIERELRVIRLERSIFQNTRVQAALADMSGLLDDGNLTNAYQIRQTLLADYPSLANDTSLLKVMKRLGALEAQQVKTEKTAPLELPAVAPFLPVNAQPPSDIEGPIVALHDPRSGNAVGVASKTGQTVWQAFIGLDSFTPQPLSDARGAGFVVWQSRLQQAQRLDDRGEVVWRQRLASCDFRPLVVGTSVYLVQESQLFELSATDGSLQRAYRFPQPLAGRPTSTPGGLIVLAEHSHGFLINAAKRRVESSVYLGHRGGDSPFPAAYNDRFAFVLQYDGQTQTNLLVLNRKTLEIAQTLPLSGRAIQGPVVAGTTVAVVMADRVQAVRITTASRRPCRVAAAHQMASVVGIAASAEKLWVSGESLVALPLPAPETGDWQALHDLGSTPNPVSISLDKDQVLAAQRHYPVGLAIVSYRENDGTSLWKKTAGTPPLLSLRSGSSPTVRSLIIHQADESYWSSNGTLTRRTATRVDSNELYHLFASNNGRASVLVNLLDKKSSLQVVDLPGETAFDSPYPLLVPIDSGPLFLLGTNGQPSGAPLLPVFSKTGLESWISVWIDDGGNDSEGRADMTAMLSGRNKAKPIKGVAATAHTLIGFEASSNGLKETAHAVLDKAIASEFCHFDRRLYFVSEDHQLSRINPETLESLGKIALNSPAQHGPTTVAGKMYVATSGGKLHHIADDAIDWTAQIPEGEVVGVGPAPLDRKGCAVATSSGAVHIVADDGSIQSSVATGRRLAGRPALVESGLLLSTDDGHHFIIPHSALGN